MGETNEYNRIRGIEDERDNSVKINILLKTVQQSLDEIRKTKELVNILRDEIRRIDKLKPLKK